MFNYKICVKCDEHNMEMDCRTIEHASEQYFLLMNCGGYREGYVMDNRTGEVYAHFEYDNCGLTCWVANTP